MIKTKDLVPEVYYNRSRDFQLLGRTYDVVFNYMKMNADLIENNPLSDDVDDNLIPLLCTSLGFKETHEYNTDQMRALWTLASIQDLLNLLVNVENENDEAHAEVDMNNSYLLNIYMPLSISDTSLFEDMLKYVLPAGMSYRLVRENPIKKEINDVIYLESDLVGPASEAAIKAFRGEDKYMSQLYGSKCPHCDRFISLESCKEDEDHNLLCPYCEGIVSDILESLKDFDPGRLEDMTVAKITDATSPTDLSEGWERLYQEEENNETEEEEGD